MISEFLTIRYSSPSILICVPAYLSYMMVSPTFTVTGSFSVPGPTASTVAVWVFSWAASGIIMPDAVFDSAFAGFTRTLSAKGLIFS